MITISKLKADVKSWYETAQENDKIAALNIGYSIICSDTYNKNSDSRSIKLQQHIDTLTQKLDLLTQERDEARTNNANESLNRIMTQAVVQTKQQLINSINESHKVVIDTLKSEKQILKDSLDEYKSKLRSSEDSNNQLKQSADVERERYNELNQQIKCSKTKGNMGEQQIQSILEDAGYIIKKWGNKAGDIAVYSKDDAERLILCIEAKNYDTNANKLGKNGKEIDKFYRDIKEQLESKKSPVYQNSNVPWMFISLKLQIPNIDSLVRQYLGVNCFYVSEPTTESLIASVEIFDAASYAFTKNTQNENYVKTKISELYSLLKLLNEDMYDFNKIDENIETLKKTVTKQHAKLKKKIETIRDSVRLITNDIENPEPKSDSDINLNLDVSNLPHNQILAYIKQLQLDSKQIRMKQVIQQKSNEHSNTNSLDVSTEQTINTSKSNELTKQISKNSIGNLNDEINNLEESSTNEIPNTIITIDEGKTTDTAKNKLVTCDNCGKEVARKNLSRHKKTNKCKNYEDLLT